jgi:hypothetical protein
VVLVSDSSDVTAHPASPTPASPAPPVETTKSEDAGDAAKPRRTGWWAKRLLGQ